MSQEQHTLWLQKNVALFRRLPAELRTELLEMIPGFIKHVNWEGKDGQAITEEMKVCIAGEACLPVLCLTQGLKTYRKLMNIEIYPAEFSPNGEGARQGDATARKVRLGWSWVQQGMADGEDGFNLVLHEFAHVIDFASLDSKADGVPPFDDYMELREWEKFVADQFEGFQREAGGNLSDVDHYGSSNEAEFFACATESFFERGARFQMEWPEVYERLQTFYQVDPAKWPADPTPPLPEIEPEPETETEFEPEPEPVQSIAPEPEPPSDSTTKVEVRIDEKGTGSLVEYHPNGKRACHWELNHHHHDGPWRRWSIEGELLEEGWYRKGKRDGQYCLYFPDGSMRVEGRYKNDRRDGKWRRHREDGEVKQEDFYEAGKLVRWEQWDLKGQSKKIGAWDS